MTCAGIQNIVVTIGMSQLILDLVFNHFVYKGESYKRALRTMERSQTKLKRAEQDLAKSEAKHRKKYDRTKDEYSQACADVARRHTMPQMTTSVCFLILLKILGAEYQGKVMGVLPFTPFNLITKVSTRGLADWKIIPLDDLKATGTAMQPQQAFSFLFVYMLASMTVKYYVHQAVAIQPPPGADGGMSTIVESPMGQAIAKNMGFDPAALKPE
ncbi:MAG: hypothetical protein SGILL_008719 [Bacillariaceae sp.]